MFSQSTESHRETEELLFPKHIDFAFVFPASQEDAKHEISKSRHFRAQSISHRPRTLPILGIVKGNPHLTKAAAILIAAIPLGQTDFWRGGSFGVEHTKKKGGLLFVFHLQGKALTALHFRAQ